MKLEWNFQKDGRGRPKEKNINLYVRVFVELNIVQ